MWHVRAARASLLVEKKLEIISYERGSESQVRWVMIDYILGLKKVTFVSGQWSNPSSGEWIQQMARDKECMYYPHLYLISLLCQHSLDIYVYIYITGGGNN